MKTKRVLLLFTLFFVFFICGPAWKSESGPATGAQSLLAADQAKNDAPRVRVIVRFAKIRSLANAGAKIIKEIGFGTILLVMGENGEYFRVADLNVSAKPQADAWYVLRSEVETAPAAAVQALTESRRVTYSPSAPVAGQPLLFTASNFRTPNLLKWDMGDGTILTSGGKAAPGQEVTMAYAYAAAGQFQVRVYDDKGNMGSTPVRAQVTVSAQTRVLHIAPEQPLANHPMVITAQHFRTPERIAWDLGDGTEINPGPGPGVVKATFQVSHVYTAAGSYSVKAYDSGGDKNQPPLTAEFVVGADPRQIRMEPAKAIAGLPMQFSASNFNSPNHLRWDMGDGTILPGEKETNVLVGSSVNYSYKKPGNYLVKIYDWQGDLGRHPVQFVVAVAAAPDVIAVAAPTISAPGKTQTLDVAAAAPPAPKKFMLFRVGPYAGYFQPKSIPLKEIYGKGDVLYGGRLGVHIWQGLYFWFSASQYKVISQTTFTEDKTTLTLLPVHAFLRYTFALGFFNPYLGVGFNYLSFKEESVIGNVKGSGSNLSLEAGFEFKVNRHFSFDFGARFDQIKIKPENIDVEVDLGGLQAGICLLISF